jgi:hypothetical protein
MAADVLSKDDFAKWSLNMLAHEFGVARETVQNRLASANIQPAGERRGFPVYRVGPSAKAILQLQMQSAGFNNDPNTMSPQERSYWYKSENDRTKLEKEQGILVYAEDSRRAQAQIAKTGLQILETLPDILERDFNLSVDVISAVEDKLNALRDEWAELVEQA